MMKKLWIGMAILSGLSLAACGNKTDANEKNFKETINTYLNKTGNECLATGDSWPSVLVLEDEVKKNDGLAKKMAALQAAGLMKSEKIIAATLWTFGRKIPMVRYTPTDAAKPYLNPNPMGVGSDFGICWGKRSVDKIDQWRLGKDLDGYKMAAVDYTYKVVDIADWAKRPDILAAFPEIGKAEKESGTEMMRAHLVLSNKGWERASNGFN